MGSDSRDRDDRESFEGVVTEEVTSPDKGASRWYFDHEDILKEILEILKGRVPERYTKGDKTLIAWRSLSVPTLNDKGIGDTMAILQMLLAKPHGLGFILDPDEINLNCRLLGQQLVLLYASNYRDYGLTIEDLDKMSSLIFGILQLFKMHSSKSLGGRGLRSVTESERVTEIRTEQPKGFKIPFMR